MGSTVKRTDLACCVGVAKVWKGVHKVLVEEEMIIIGKHWDRRGGARMMDIHTETPYRTVS